MPPTKNDDVGQSRGTTRDGGPGAILGAATAQLRAVLGTLDEWPAIRQRFLAQVPDGEDAIDAGGRWGLIDLRIHVGLNDAAREVLGDHAMHEVGRQCMAAEIDRGVYATVFRSWMRTVAMQPTQFLRIVPYLWRIALPTAGPMHFVEGSESHMRFRVDHPPRELHESRGWQLLIEGLGHGIFDLLDVQGESRVEPVAADEHAMDFLFRWELR